MNYYRLDEICEINPPKTISSALNDEISFVPMDAVSTDGKIDTSKTILAKNIKNYTTFRNGDILFAKITPCMENGKGAIATGLKNGYGAGSTEFIVLRPNTEKITQKWLQLFLSQKLFRLYCQQNMTGSAGQKRVPPKFLATCVLPIPTLEMQEQIISRIEELFSQLDSGVEPLKKIKQQLTVYRQAVLKEAFDKYHDFVPLGQISERIFDGPFGSHLKTADYTNDGIRVVRLENIKSGWFDDSKQSYVSPDKYETICAHTVFPSDLIMSTFISESIKICQLPQSIKFAVNKADCVGIRLKNDIQPNFILFYLLSRQAYVALIHQVHGATRPRVNTKQIKAILVPLANGDMQKETVAEVERKLSICYSIEQTVDAALQQANTMRQSILKQAFDGRL